jgi:hypothetical protein
MTPPKEAAQDTYRLIITRCDSSAILVVARGSALPTIAVPRVVRIAGHLTAGVRAKWNLRAWCLLISSSATSGPDNSQVSCAVMETIDPPLDPPAGTRWVSLSDLRADPEGASRDAFHAVKSCFAEIAKERIDPRSFSRPGWIEELLAWTEEQVISRGRRVTGDFRQFNASSTFSLVRMETTGPAVWFKATGRPHLHELPVTLALARLAPGCMPTVLGVHDVWNGWLTDEAPGHTLDEIEDVDAWECAARTLAELQIALIGKRVELLEAGCKDLTTQNLAARIDLFLTRIAALGLTSEDQHPSYLGNAELSFLSSRLKESCDRLRQINLPDTIGHVDFNPGNIVCCAERSIFLDWAEASVTSPLTTFEYLRESARRGQIRGPGALDRINAAYLRPWRAVLSADHLGEALVLSPLIAVFAYALACDSCHDQPAPVSPERARYLRSLARRMYREAAHQVQEREPCLR